MSIIASAEDLRQQILESAVASLDCPREQAIALFLVDALDSRGFLAVDLEEIAAMAGEELETAERVLATIQDIAPAGVGARSLQECLLLQARYLRAEGVSVPEVVFPLISDHLEELAAKRTSRIARALDVDVSAIEDAQRFIREQLTPHPLQSHQFSTWTSPSTAGHVVPDVVVTIDGDRLAIEVPNAIYDRLDTNAFYRAIARPSAGENGASPAQPGITPGNVDAEAVSHAKAQVGRAQQFIWAVRQRRQTLLRVAEYVCAYQEAFIRGDARGLRPLTRSEVANALGVHESTCSRAVAGKFIMLPSRKVIPMSDLFVASLSIKHVIQEIIREEAEAGRALSDAQISARLLDHGIRIARRTVAKYRSQMHILPSTIR
jgi:RNA polymerase sigma-54 factor